MLQPCNPKVVVKKGPAPEMEMYIRSSIKQQRTITDLQLQGWATCNQGHIFYSSDLLAQAENNHFYLKNLQTSHRRFTEYASTSEKIVDRHKKGKLEQVEFKDPHQK